MTTEKKSAFDMLKVIQTPYGPKFIVKLEALLQEVNKELNTKK